MLMRTLRNLTARLCLTVAVLLGSTGVSIALPICEGSPIEGSLSDTKLWDNCLATLIFTSGSKYVGEWKAGKANGHGTYTIANGDKYDGEFKDGSQSGHGTYTFADGMKYVGEFKNGKKNGQGTISYPKGAKYVGEFKDGKKNGQGVATFSDGGSYVGGFKDGTVSGQGTHTKSNGDKYVGGFKNEQYNGQGTYTFANGSKYVGEFKGDIPNGQGIFIDANGGEYVGEYKGYVPHGQGTFVSASGDKYIGEFKDGKKAGQGIVTFANGGKYVGEFKNDKRSGHGTFTFPDENINKSHTGQWTNGLPNGLGIRIYSNGTTEEGVFENGRFLFMQKVPPVMISGKRPEPSNKSGTSGSGFFVSKLGHIITNQHVVSDCKEVTVGDSALKQVAATVLETDRRNDLALLKISSTVMASAETKSLIQKLGISIEPKSDGSSIPLSSSGLMRAEDVELGEDLLVAGYPYGKVFSDTIKVTKGIVSANRGLGDDTGQFQMDAAVQPGNSGGPIYDDNGNIVGVVVSQLNKMKFAKSVGSIPENVNFGIKASTVRQFLSASGLPTKWSSRTKSMSTKDLAKIAKMQTVMVMCYR
jgi:V8-like Glu-specific endopeptidase